MNLGVDADSVQFTGVFYLAVTADENKETEYIAFLHSLASRNELQKQNVRHLQHNSSYPFPRYKKLKSVKVQFHYLQNKYTGFLIERAKMRFKNIEMKYS